MPLPIPSSTRLEFWKNGRWQKLQKFNENIIILYIWKSLIVGRKFYFHETSNFQAHQIYEKSVDGCEHDLYKNNQALKTIFLRNLFEKINTNFEIWSFNENIFLNQTSSNEKATAKRWSAGRSSQQKIRLWQQWEAVKLTFSFKFSMLFMKNIFSSWWINK